MNQRLLKIGSFLVLLIFIFFFVDNSWAAQKQSSSVKKQRTSVKKQKVLVKKQRTAIHEKNIVKDGAVHIVMKGDTLFRIAKLNGLSINELKELNNLKKTKLKIGQRLIVKKKHEKEKIEDVDVEKKELAYKEQAYDEVLEEPVVEAQNKGPVSKILSYAKDLLGVPYRFGGTTLRAIDCSALVQKVFKSIDIALPRTVREQFKIGRDIERDDVSEGDLVFFKTYASYPSHVGIYIGDNQFIHASRTERKVSIDSLDEPYYRKRFIGAKRLIEVEVIAEPSHNDKPS